jgi:glycosyltransferase involved in cell wall biosynthesis
MMKNRLVIITQYFPPEMGAPQSRLLETAIGLQSKGWDVRIVAAMPNYPTGKIFKSHQNKFHFSELVRGIRVWRYWLYASNSKNAIHRILSMLSFSITVLFSVLKLKKFKPNFIFTESPPLTLGLSGIILAKLTRAKHVLNVSDLWPLSAFELGAISDGFLYKRLEGLEKYLYRSSYACTGQSQEILHQISLRGSKRSHLYRNGVDLNRFSDVQMDNKTKDDILKIVYAGLLGIAQGILQICREIDFAAIGAEFHIYGDGYEREQIIVFLNGNESRGIVLHSPKKRDQIPNTLMNYDVTLIPLIKPIFGAVPSKIYESMAAGLPIIFNGGGEGNMIVEENRVGWICEPQDFNNLVRIIKEVSNMHDDEFGRYMSNCFAAATEKFSRHKQIDQLNNFLLDKHNIDELQKNNV